MFAARPITNPSSVTVATVSSPSQTSSTVVAAGAWTNNVLAHLNTQLDVEVWRVHWGHYKLKEGQQSPQWFHFGKGDALYYGFPGENGIAKVGVDFSPAHDQV